MKIARGLLLAGILICPTSLSAASRVDDVIYVLLDHFAQGSPSGTHDCVEPTLDPRFSLLRRRRSEWGDWQTAADTSLPRSIAQRLNHLFSEARELHPAGKRIIRVPPPLILSDEDRPASGPCALEGNKEEVWHWYTSQPTLKGSWAFVEIGALANGKYPPPQLWALEYKGGRWLPRYKATRVAWAD